MRINTPPTLQSYRNHLRDFVDLMVSKLHQNSHKTTPTKEDIPKIIEMLREELAEFEEQYYSDKHDPNVLTELCDASNFAFLAFVALRNQGVMNERETFIDTYFDINVEEGKVYVKKSRSGSPYKVGEEIRGTKNKDGYVYIRAQNKAGGSWAGCSMPRSHLVWWKANGVWPTGVMDHRNRVRDDDRIENLRDVSCSTNNLNTGKKSKLPPFVTCYRPTGRDHLKHFGKYVYQRRFKGIAHRYGYYDNPEEAEREGLKRFCEQVGYSPTLDL